MIIDDFYVKCIAIVPSETDAPALVDANAVSSRAISFQHLQSVPGRHAQVLQPSRRIQVQQLAPCDAFDRSEPLHWPVMEQQLRFRTAEQTDHISSLLREKEYVKRNSWPASPTDTICK